MERKICEECGEELDKNGHCKNCDPKVANRVLTEDVLKRNTKQNDNSKIVFVFVLTFILLVSSVAGILAYVDYCFDNLNVSSKESTSKSYKNVTINDTGLADAVEKVYDAVVVVKNYSGNTLRSTGTGFVYDSDNDYGYILTNHHVIDSGRTIKVEFTDGNEYDASVVGSDEYLDVAVLKIEKKYIISTAIIGSSEDMRVGDTTFAVGSPVDSDLYSWTVTRGILSGKDRLVESSESNVSVVFKVLQTDTAINSGNSGGPLCNANGEVIGITNMKIVTSSVEGIGFAIPIEIATKYANDIRSGKESPKPYLGINMSDRSTFFGESGVYVTSVGENTPASKAGLKVGDMITKFGGVSVKSSGYLRYELYKYSPGDTVEITYKRNNKETTTKITLGTYPKE